MSAILALLAAAGFGVSDFVAGLASKRSHSAVVTTVAESAGGLTALVLALVAGASTTLPALGWGVVGGVGSAFGTLALYRGLAVGRMAVVAPVSAVTSASLPVLLGVALGERPGGVAWLGILLAVPATALVSRVGDDHGGRSGLLEGLVAGLGFSLIYLGLDRAGDNHGTWPVAAEMITSALLTAPLTIWVLRSRSNDPGGLARADRLSLVGAVVAGLLVTAASVAFLASSARGGLAVAAVVTSLYPAFTVLLAWLLLREPVRHVQAVGLLAAAASVVLVAV